MISQLREKIAKLETQQGTSADDGMFESSAVLRNGEANGQQIALIEKMRELFFERWSKRLEQLDNNIRLTLDYRIDEMGYDQRMRDASAEVQQIERFREELLQRLRRLGLASVQPEAFLELQEQNAQLLKKGREDLLRIMREHERQKEANENTINEFVLELSHWRLKHDLLKGELTVCLFFII